MIMMINVARTTSAIVPNPGEDMTIENIKMAMVSDRICTNLDDLETHFASITKNRCNN